MFCKSTSELINEYGPNWISNVNISGGPYTSLNECYTGCSFILSGLEGDYSVYNGTYVNLNLINGPWDSIAYFYVGGSKWRLGTAVRPGAGPAAITIEHPTAGNSNSFPTTGWPTTYGNLTFS